MIKLYSALCLYESSILKLKQVEGHHSCFYVLAEQLQTQQYANHACKMLDKNKPRSINTQKLHLSKPYFVAQIH